MIAFVPRRSAGLATLSVFVAATLLSASMLFMVQPMAVRMILPRLGGSPSVWNTAMVFFQLVLVLGYFYAHVLTRRVSVSRQLLVHVCVLAVPLIVLPMRLPHWRPPADQPVLWLVAVLASAVGLPFLAVTTASPLLQRWFAHTDHRHARDPYPLYAASNVGSLIGLAAYPVVVERSLGLREQAWMWAGLYVVFCALMITAGLLSRRTAGAAPGAAAAAGVLEVDSSGEAEPDTDVGGVGTVHQPRSRGELWGQRARWIGLAAVPSALSLAITASLSIDVASAPFLWVLPLSVYLLTFIVAFGRRRLIPVPVAGFAVPICVAALAAALHGNQWPSVSVAFAMQLLTLFAVGTLCHGRLNEERPRPDRLTEFFVLISIGGVIGGAMTALLAPIVFTRVFELPLALCAAVLARHRWLNPSRWVVVDIIVFLGFAFTLALVLTPNPQVLATLRIDRLLDRVFHVDAVDLEDGHLWLRRVLRWDDRYRFAFVGGLVGAMALSRRRVAASLCASLLAFSVLQIDPGVALFEKRTFFGALRVSCGGWDENDDCLWVNLDNGTTLHGQQFLGAGKRSIATSYYYRTGPAGSVMTALENDPRHDRVGIVGLGAGTLASYSRPGDRFTYFEIDPVVVRIARDPALFTYLRDAQGEVDVVLGDARLTLSDQPSGEFGVLLIDAFSSDAIPVHLLTRESIAMYLSKLRPDGLLLVHVSNRHLSLAPVVGKIAKDLGVTARTFDDGSVSLAEEEELKSASSWVVLAKDPLALNGVADLAADRWTETVVSGSRTWTDDYANLLDVLDWKS